MPVRVSQLSIRISANFDYYRPLTIQYLSDSVKTEKGWKYSYRTLANGTLNSMEENTFKFRSTTVRKLKIIIHNDDNQPLSVEAIEAKGYEHQLIARFTDRATYYLTYGNQRAARPNYDIQRFSSSIPAALTPLELGEEVTLEKAKLPTAKPLFENQAWLWGIMLVIILLLGGFSVNMMRKK